MDIPTKEVLLKKFGMAHAIINAEDFDPEQHAEVGAAAPTEEVAPKKRGRPAKDAE